MINKYGCKFSETHHSCHSVGTLEIPCQCYQGPAEFSASSTLAPQTPPVKKARLRTRGGMVTIDVCNHVKARQLRLQYVSGLVFAAEVAPVKSENRNTKTSPTRMLKNCLRNIKVGALEQFLLLPVRPMTA